MSERWDAVLEVTFALDDERSFGVTRDRDIIRSNLDGIQNVLRIPRRLSQVLDSGGGSEVHQAGDYLFATVVTSRTDAEMFVYRRVHLAPLNAERTDYPTELPAEVRTAVWQLFDAPAYVDLNVIISTTDPRVFNSKE